MRESTILPLVRKQLQQRLLRLPIVGHRTWTVRSVGRRCAASLVGLIEVAVLAFGWLMLPVWPFVGLAITRDIAWLRRYPRTLGAVMRHLEALWRAHAIERVLLPRFGVSRPAQSGTITGECTHCGNCCLNRSCIFLSYDAQGRSSCQIYGSRLWEGLACGDYPVDRMDIALYRCPSFTVVSSPGSIDAKVIPIFPVPVADPTPVAVQAESRAGHRRSKFDGA
jgi:hypothetical protein